MFVIAILKSSINFFSLISCMSGFVCIPGGAGDDSSQVCLRSDESCSGVLFGLSVPQMEIAPISC